MVMYHVFIYIEIGGDVRQNQVLLAHFYFLIFHQFPRELKQCHNLTYLRFPVVLVFPVDKKTSTSSDYMKDDIFERRRQI